MRAAILLVIGIACVLIIYRAATTTTHVLLTTAMEEAVENYIAKMDNSAPANLNGDDLLHTQMIGDIMQDATSILIKNHGTEILSQLEGIDAWAILELLLKSIATKPSSCIDRPTICNKSFPYRSISGWCNHDDAPNRSLGSTMHPLRRYMGAPKYDDGFNAIRRKSANGGVIPSARDISNKIFADATIPSFDPKYNHFLMQFGQWITHDLILTPPATGPRGEPLDCSLCESAELTTTNCCPIEVPEDDTYFPTNTSEGGKTCIRMTRAINGQTGIGPRQPFNQNSHFLDLSTLYGSTECIARELRTLQNGKMKMYSDAGHDLPPQDMNDPECQSQKLIPPFPCFSAGDKRNSVHPGLVAMHTIYLKQHNRFAEQIKVLRPTWSDNQIYHETRRLMIAIHQSHVYTEYLPKVIGEQKMKEFDLNPSALKSIYDAAINPSISIEFGDAAFRFGHTQVRHDIPRMTNTNESIGAPIDLGQSIMYTDSLYDKTTSTGSIAQGMVNCPGMSVDRHFPFALRHEISYTRGIKASGVDLPAINVQRGRERGVYPYNAVREQIPGLGGVASFDALASTMEKENIDLVKKVYDSVDDIDLYVGVLLEKIEDPTALVGPIGTYLIAEQFAALKKGDRFFYENSATAGALTQAEYDAIRNYSLAQLICENTDGMDQVQAEIFLFKSPMVQCKSFAPFPLDRILSATVLGVPVDPST